MSARAGPRGVAAAASRNSSCARIALPASNRWPAASTRRRMTPSRSAGGVSSQASSASSAAESGAPRARANRAASSSAAAIDVSGPADDSARWRARSSGSVARSARARWTARRSSGEAPAYTVDASSGCVNRTWRARISMTPARSAAARASGAARSNPDAAATRSGVGWDAPRRRGGQRPHWQEGRRSVRGAAPRGPGERAGRIPDSPSRARAPSRSRGRRRDCRPSFRGCGAGVAAATNGPGELEASPGARRGSAAPG